MEQVLLALFTMVVAVLGCIGYFWGSNWLLGLIYPDKGKNGAANIQKSAALRPWLFMGPAILLLSVYLIYPVFNSLYLSLHGSSGQEFVGFANYTWLINDEKFAESFINNMLWLGIVPAASTFFGLLAAALTDRISWGNIAKSLIFMPMAISFIGASIIWKFVYDFRGEEVEQIGILNAILVHFGAEPQAWIVMPVWNSVFLMIILIWIQTGFAMVILSAALRGIPEETLEAATLDGANPLQIFLQIKVPQIWGSVAVVWTTITILVLKVFDIVMAMTNGQWGSQVLANYMFDWMFRGHDFGRSATIALVIMLLVLPVMIWNVRNLRKEN
ncbi:MAG: binding-protein-dependent transport system inner membrane protein [Osedax symbiont Rs2]|nr:MAG: binding-protein-dependent transport system inner membrane protein [Osedax symbiont Rs2]